MNDSSSLKKIFKYVIGIIILFLVLYPTLTNHSVLTPIAVGSNSPSLCERITNVSIGASLGDFVINCYSSVAIANNDVSVCNNLVNTVDEAGRILGNRDKCYTSFAVAFKDASVCANPDNLDADDCYVDYSRITEEIKSCKNIENVRQQTFCYEYFRTKAGDACFKINDDLERLRCIKQDACSNYQC